MRAPPIFWWRPYAGPTALMLAPAARLWAWQTVRRMREAPRLTLGVPVICVGNFVVGGAGKTPTVIELARIVTGLGFRPGFLTRGYGGTAKGPLLVTPASHGPEEVGDEALLLAARAPTVVSGDRPAGARLLLRAGVDFILMDDGFQNPGLHKDASFLVIDAASGLGNGRCVPAGPMRAPLAPQLAAAAAVIVMGEGDAAAPVVRAAARAGKPIWRARIGPDRTDGWEGRPVLAYAGIGRPDKFFSTLSEVGATVKLARRFPDHHAFSEAEAEELLERARSEGLRLATTGKDMARLTGRDGAAGRLAAASDVLAVHVEFEHEDAVARTIVEVVRRVARRAV